MHRLTLSAHDQHMTIWPQGRKAVSEDVSEHTAHSLVGEGAELREGEHCGEAEAATSEILQ